LDFKKRYTWYEFLFFKKYMAQLTALFLVKYGGFFVAGLFLFFLWLVLFLLLRALLLWYWKIDKTVLLLEEIKSEIAQQKKN
jgi:hypothetical protein